MTPLPLTRRPVTAAGVAPISGWPIHAACSRKVRDPTAPPGPRQDSTLDRYYVVLEDHAVADGNVLCRVGAW